MSYAIKTQTTADLLLLLFVIIHIFEYICAIKMTAIQNQHTDLYHNIYFLFV